MQNRAALKKQAIDNSIKELEKFKENALIGTALFYLNKIKNEEKGYAIEWSEESSEKNMNVLQEPRNLLIEVLKLELQKPNEYPKDLCDSAHAVLVVLTKYWPRNKYVEKQAEADHEAKKEFVPQCPVGLSDLSYDIDTQDFIFHTHDGWQLDLNCCATLSMHPMMRAPFIQRDLNYMRFLLESKKDKVPSRNVVYIAGMSGAAIGFACGCMPSLIALQVLALYFAEGTTTSAFAIFVSTFTLVGSHVLAWLAVMIAPMIIGTLIGYGIGGLVGVLIDKFSTVSGTPNPKISQLLNSIEPCVAPTPPTPVLSNNLINDRLLASPAEEKKPVTESKCDNQDSPKKLSSPPPRKNEAWLARVERQAAAAKAANPPVAQPKRGM